MLCCLPNAASDKHTYILTYFIVTPSKGFSVTRQIIKTKKVGGNNSYVWKIDYKIIIMHQIGLAIYKIFPKRG